MGRLCESGHCCPLAQPDRNSLRLTHFSAGPDGRSTFTEIDLDYPLARDAADGTTLAVSNALVSPAVQFVTLPADLNVGLHPAPSRQVVSVLNGQLEVGTPDGQTRRFDRGDLFLADDVATDEHTTEVIDGPVEVLYIPLPEGTVYRTRS